MFNRDFWVFVNTFAEWLSALGTIAAVIVALFLARRDSHITLAVVVGIRLLLRQGVEGRPEFFSLDVTNIGRRPATITNLVIRDGVRVGVRRLRFGVQMVMIPPQNAFSAAVPTTITDGERASYMVPWSEFERVNGDMIRRYFAGRFGWIRARLLRIGVVVSAGGICDSRIEKQLAERLVEVARRAP